MGQQRRRSNSPILSVQDRLCDYHLGGWPRKTLEKASGQRGIRQALQGFLELDHSGLGRP